MKRLIIFSVLIYFSFSFPKSLLKEQVLPSPQMTAKQGLITPKVSLPMITTSKTDQPPPFGTIVQQWTLNMGGTYQGAGITWRQDSGRFYLMAQGKRVYSFKPENPPGTFRQERWNFQSVGGSDIPFGLAWDQDSGCFWISHIAMMFSDARLWRYIWDPVADSWEWAGQPRDTWQIGSGSNAYSGGMCKNVEGGFFWTIYVPTNPIMKLDPYTKAVVGSTSNAPGNDRGVTWIPYDSNYVITCGWYSDLVKRDTLGNIIQACSTYLPYADCELWVPEFPNPYDTVFIFAITSDTNNTLYKISTGMEWSIIYGPHIDVGTRQILSPTGFLDSASVITPCAIIRNYGGFPVNEFYTQFWIFRAYDSVIVYRDSFFIYNRLFPQEEDTLFFTPFAINIPRGNYVVKCSTMLYEDDYPWNNAIQLTLPVHIHNIGVIGIVNPRDTVYYGDSIVPQIWVKNYGTVTDSFWMMLRITPAYHESSYVILLTSPPESTQKLISFPVWVAGPPGLHILTCSIPKYGFELLRCTIYVIPVALSEYNGNLKEKEITAIPNPFNNRVLLSYNKVYKGPAFLAIYNLEGRIISNLVNQQQEPGQYKIYWDGKDSDFKDMPAGIYFILWQSGEKTTIKKIIRK